MHSLIKQKGVAEEVIDEALSALDEQSQVQAAQEILQKGQNFVLQNNAPQKPNAEKNQRINTIFLPVLTSWRQAMLNVDRA